MLVAGGGDEGLNNAKKPEKRLKSSPKYQEAGVVGESGHKTPPSNYGSLVSAHTDAWGLPVGQEDLNTSHNMHLSDSKEMGIEASPELLKETLLNTFGINAGDMTSQSGGNTLKSLGIKTENWYTDIDIKAIKDATELQKPAENVPEKPSLKKSIFNLVFKGTSEPKEAPITNPKDQPLRADQGIPTRSALIINHYRAGDKDKAQDIYNRMGNNPAEIRQINSALEKGLPWARELIDIVEPEARINETFAAKNAGHDGRAKILSHGEPNKEQVTFLASNKDISERFLDIVKSEKPEVTSVTPTNAVLH